MKYCRDIAVVAWQKQEQLKDQDSIEPWLYRIAIRQVLMFWRKNKRHKGSASRHVPLGECVSDTEDKRTPDPLDWITSLEAHQQVRDALAKLNSQDREILLLKHVESWTYEQISDRLGITYDKVVYRLSRARDRMREQLSGYERDGKLK